MGQCFHPIPALNLGIGQKPKILGLHADDNLAKLKEKYGDDLLLLPCGHCIECSLEYSKQWALRIMLESTLYDRNCFITLTYDDKHLPKDGKLNHWHFQKFMKRLRQVHPDVRYFMCGEYGEKGHRPHYHAILFNCDFYDKKVITSLEFQIHSKNDCLYTSRELQDIWKNGLVSIGEVTTQSAAYVARYSLKKKLTGFEDGSYVRMSRRPGLARDLFDYKWFHTNKIYTKDAIYSVPRFFQKVYMDENPLSFECWKQHRIIVEQDKRYAYGFSNPEQVFEYLENMRNRQFKNLRGF